MVDTKTNELWKELSAETIQGIQLEVLNGVSVENSTMKYTPVMKQFRDKFEKERAANPAGTVYDIPTL